jgi:crotonobetainyl-CoA:carnitine CoA-transferase CaiB-like acyl-CoA transferase
MPAATSDSGTPGGALDGVRVLDFSALLQGPWATQILGDLGAEIIKIEKPGGEWMRHWGTLAATTAGETCSFLSVNRNKKSVELDLKDPEAIRQVLALARTADVVVENFRPGVMDRLGIGYERLREVNPRIVYVASSGYGQSGPYADRPGQDLLIQALSGLTWLTGRAEDPPTPAGIGVADEFTALHIAIAVLAGLQSRHTRGVGQRIDVDLLTCAVAAQQQELTVHLNHDVPMQRARNNVGYVGGSAPYGIYPTADGHIALAMFHCPTLGEILGVDWLAPFDTTEKMFAGRDEVYELLAAHLAGGTTDHWLELLLAHDVWAAKVQSYADLERDPQLAHRGIFWDVPVGDGSASFRTVGSPFVFSDTPPAVRLPVPRSGQHTAECLAEIEERA